mgnify:CR=1 FL=1
MKNMLSVERAPALIAIFSAVVLAISITYDFGYLAYSGLSFSEVPTTISDHIRSSLAWIPPTIIMLFGMLAMELLNRRIEQGKTEEELIAASPTSRFTAWFRESPKYVLMAFALLVLISPFLGVELPIEAWMFGLIILWFMLHGFFFSHERILKRTSKEFYLASRWLPALIIFISFSGAAEAKKLHAAKQYVFEIGDTNKVAALGRSYDNYYLIWNSETNAVEFISRSIVKAFYPRAEKKSNKKDDKTARASS